MQQGNDYDIGDRVALIGGTYKRFAYGRVVGLSRCKVKVEIDGLTETKNLMRTSVKKLPKGKPNKEDYAMDSLTKEIELLREEIKRLRIAVERK